MPGRVVNAWAVIGLMLLTATVMGSSLLLLGRLVRPVRPNPMKEMPYESGVPDVAPPRARYTPRFYVVAMLFVIFDIEAVFIFPWAVSLDSGSAALGWFGFWEMTVFVVVLTLGLVHAWRKGVLRWA